MISSNLKTNGNLTITRDTRDEMLNRSCDERLPMYIEKEILAQTFCKPCKYFGNHHNNYYIFYKVKQESHILGVYDFRLNWFWNVTLYKKQSVKFFESYALPLHIIINDSQSTEPGNKSQGCTSGTLVSKNKYDQSTRLYDWAGTKQLISWTLYVRKM